MKKGRGELKNKKDKLFSVKSGQVWVETVIYTLVAFALIGLVLSFVKPKVEEIQDKSVITQSIEVMQNINNVIDSLEKNGAGNKRLIELMINKGELNFDCNKSEIIFEIESTYTYSEPGAIISEGDLIIQTLDTGENNLIIIKRNYIEDFNLTCNGEDKTISITKSPNLYKVFFSNKGENVIDIEVN